MVDPASLEQLDRARIDQTKADQPDRERARRQPGAAVGKVVFSADRAVEWAKAGDTVILVRPETTPDDIHGMAAAAGILTSRGGGGSHAAVVARGMGKARGDRNQRPRGRRARRPGLGAIAARSTKATC